MLALVYLSMTNGRATGISSEPAPGTEPRKFYGPVERATFSASPPSPPPLALSFPSVRLFFTFAPRFALLIYRANRGPLSLSLSLSLSWVSGDYYVVTGSSGRN